MMTVEVWLQIEVVEADDMVVLVIDECLGRPRIYSS